MQFDDLKPIESGYDGSKVVFYLRMISVAEEEDIMRRLRDILDVETPERYSRQYSIIRSVLSEYSARLPERNGVPFEVGAGFAEQTPANERILMAVFTMFRQQLDPDTRFLEPSPPPAGVIAFSQTNGEN
jgi:hypothetical protein